MNNPPPVEKPAAHPFDEVYFKSGPYQKVSFGKYSQYWWSNRFYATLARKFAPTPPPAPPRATGRGENVTANKTGPAILEVGCGLGHLLQFLPPTWQLAGCDINEWALEQARHNVPRGRFELCSAEDLSPFAGGSFQVLVAKHVVEHLPNPAAALAEFSRVLAPGGLLVLATPNFDSPMRAWKKENWIGYQDKTHISLKPPSEWLTLLRAASIQPKKVFSDGFWDAPYLPLLPTKLQKLMFGGPGGLQAILGWSILPLWLGESLIVLAHKTPVER